MPTPAQAVIVAGWRRGSVTAGFVEIIPPDEAYRFDLNILVYGITFHL